MRKRIFAFAVAAMMMVACQKEDNIRPIIPQTSDSTPEEMASIIGNWLPAEGSSSKIYFYRQDNGAFIDSVIVSDADKGFTFYSDSTCATPWDYVLDYTHDGNKLYLKFMGYDFRTYDIQSLTQAKLIMEYRDTSLYQTTDPDGSTINVDGVEIERWVLTRDI
ncbi:MAG: hypothetical protein MJZ67_04850 [Bacteroidales bacterium]|nr:hypothetical protein [Bacteroidales bacterium]